MTELSNVDSQAGVPPRHRVLGWAARTALILAVLSCLTVVAVNMAGLTSATSAQKQGSEGSGLFYHANHERSIPRDDDGHIYLDASFGDQQVRFRFDRAAGTAVISPDDARFAGLSTHGLSYSQTVSTTTEGEVRVAPVVIKMLTLKDVTFFNVDAAVADHPLSVSLLGPGFLKRFGSYEIKDNELVLRW
jgi:clan AA aspartic protease (TIGR02281 family)